MKIYKYIISTSDPKINYIKLPDDAIAYNSSINDYGQQWLIVLNLKYWNKNYEDIFPKGRDRWHDQLVVIGEKVYIFLYNIISYEWDTISREEFEKTILPEVTSHYLIENRRSNREWKEEIEMSQWNGGLDVLCTEWKDENKKSVIVTRYETTYTPVAVSRIVGLDCNIETIRISWDNTDDKMRSWNICKSNILPMDLYNPSNWQNEIKDTTDSSLFDEMKNQYIKFIND